MRANYIAAIFESGKDFFGTRRLPTTSHRLRCRKISRRNALHHTALRSDEYSVDQFAGDEADDVIGTLAKKLGLTKVASGDCFKRKTVASWLRIPTGLHAHKLPVLKRKVRGRRSSGANEPGSRRIWCARHKVVDCLPDGRFN